MLSLGRKLIRSMNGREYVVVRSGAGSYVDGVWVGGTTGFRIMANVQPLNGSEIMRLEEGDRVRKVLKAYCADPLRVHDERAKTAADIVIYQGEYYTVRRVEQWPQYWKAILVREEQEELDNPVNYDGGSSDPDEAQYLFLDGGPSEDDPDATVVDGGNSVDS